MKQNEIDEMIKNYKDYYLRAVALGDKPDDLIIDDCCFNLKENNGDYDLILSKINDSDTKILKVPNIMTSFNIPNLFLQNYKLEKIILGDRVERIENGVFENCHYLKYINLEHIKDIGNFSFCNCMSLEKIRLKNIKTIGIEAFSGNKSLLFVDLGGKLECLSSFVFRQSPLLRKVVGTENLITIGAQCFANCTHLKTINLHSVEDLGEYAFAFCNNLLSVNLSNVQHFDEACFFRCIHLKSVELSKSIENLSKNLFYCCHHLEHVKNLENIKELGVGCFYGSGLKTADLRNCEEIGKEAFLNSNISTILISDKLKCVGDSAFSTDLKMVKSTFRDDMKSELMSYFRKDKQLVIKYYGDKENPLDDIIVGKNNDILKNAKIVRMK